MSCQPVTTIDIPGFGNLVISDCYAEGGRDEFHEVTITYTLYQVDKAIKGLVIKLDSDGNHCFEELYSDVSEDVFVGQGVA